MAALTGLIFTLVPFLVVLTVIVFVHEMGHYLVARWNGVAVETFSVGFGKELFGWTNRHGTRWRVSVIPLGGYVRFVGDMNAASASASAPDPAVLNSVPPEQIKNLFYNKSVWRRIAIVVAGPAANVIFTFLVLYALLLGYGRYTLPATIDAVAPGGAAAEAGMKPGDLVTEVDGFKVRGFSDFQRLVATSPDRPVTLIVKRDGRSVTLHMTPEGTEVQDQFGNTNRIGRIGVSRETAADEYTLYRPNPVEAVGMTFEDIRFIIERTAAFIGDFFYGRGDLDQIGGPVKVAKVSGEVASLGVVALINLTALLSLNIGIFNLLPIPVLDGGHLLYYLVEAVRGRPLSARTQEIGFRIGITVVMLLMVFTTANDSVREIAKLF